MLDILLAMSFIVAVVNSFVRPVPFILATSLFIVLCCGVVVGIRVAKMTDA